jgi:hypothetical protein
MGVFHLQGLTRQNHKIPFDRRTQILIVRCDEEGGILQSEGFQHL